MVGLRLMRLIERHSEELAGRLTEKLRVSERTPDFRRIPREELQRAAVGVYRNLGDWLLKKTEGDIREYFSAIAVRRGAEGVGLHQFVWALIISRNHLCQFLRAQAFADNVVGLYSELELRQAISQFFDRAIYYGVLGYEEASARNQTPSKPDAKTYDPPVATQGPAHRASDPATTRF
jgi:hypothetical protein